MLSDFAELLASLDDDTLDAIVDDLPDLDLALAVVDLDAVLAEHDRRVASRLCCAVVVHRGSAVGCADAYPFC